MQRLSLHAGECLETDVVGRISNAACWIRGSTCWTNVTSRRRKVCLIILCFLFFSATLLIYIYIVLPFSLPFSLLTLTLLYLIFLLFPTNSHDFCSSVKINYKTTCKSYSSFLSTCPSFVHNLCHEDVGGSERLRSPCPRHLVCYYCLRINPIHCLNYLDEDMWERWSWLHTWVL